MLKMLGKQLLNVHKQESMTNKDPEAHWVQKQKAKSLTESRAQHA